MSSEECEGTTEPTNQDLQAFYLVADEVHGFTQSMTKKLRKHLKRHEPGAWGNASWKSDEIVLEIQRCLLDGDFVSVANYAMFANYHQNRRETAERLPQALG